MPECVNTRQLRKPQQRHKELQRKDAARDAARSNQGLFREADVGHDDDNQLLYEDPRPLVEPLSNHKLQASSSDAVGALRQPLASKSGEGFHVPFDIPQADGSDQPDPAQR